MVHETRSITYPFTGESICVDKDICRLLEKIWNIGIQTDGSCQEIEPNWIWIKFTTPLDGFRFNRHIIQSICDHFKMPPDSYLAAMYNTQIIPRMCGMNTTSHIPSWKIMFPTVCEGISFWIPKEDLPIIEQFI